MQTCYPITIPIRSASPTAFDVLSLAEARKQCAIAEGNGYHDQSLTRYIATARREVEKQAMLVIATGTYTHKRTEFGYGEYFELPSSLRPVTSITSIVYTATDGTSTTWSSSQYTLDTYTIQPVVRLNYGYQWPAIRGDMNGITITAVAGYADAPSVPENVKHALLLHVSMQWQEEMNELREREATEKAYDRVIHLLRQEVYA